MAAEEGFDQAGSPVVSHQDVSYQDVLDVLVLAVGHEDLGAGGVAAAARPDVEALLARVAREERRQEREHVFAQALCGQHLRPEVAYLGDVGQVGGVVDIVDAGAVAYEVVGAAFAELVRVEVVDAVEEAQQSAVRVQLLLELLVVEHLAALLDDVVLEGRVLELHGDVRERLVELGVLRLLVVHVAPASHLRVPHGAVHVLLEDALGQLLPQRARRVRLPPAVIAELVPRVVLDAGAHVLVAVHLVHDARHVVVRALLRLLDQVRQVGAYDLLVALRTVLARPHVQRAHAQSAHLHVRPEPRALALDVLGRGPRQRYPGVQQAVVDVAQTPPQAHPLVVRLDAVGVEDRDELLHELHVVAHVVQGRGSVQQHGLHQLPPPAALLHEVLVVVDVRDLVLLQPRLAVAELVADGQELRQGGAPARARRRGGPQRVRAAFVAQYVRQRVRRAAGLLAAVHDPVVALYYGLVQDVVIAVGQGQVAEDLVEVLEHLLSHQVLHRGARHHPRDLEVDAVLDRDALGAGGRLGRRLLQDVDVEALAVHVLRELPRVEVRESQDVPKRVEPDSISSTSRSMSRRRRSMLRRSRMYI